MNVRHPVRFLLVLLCLWMSSCAASSSGVTIARADRETVPSGRGAALGTSDQIAGRDQGATGPVEAPPGPNPLAPATAGEATVSSVGSSSAPGGPTATRFTSVNAGNYHTCGVWAEGGAVCWGWDEYGQSTPPTGSFVSVSAGGFHSCGVRPDGTATCWGRNEHG